MLELYLDDRRTIARFRSSPLGPYVDDFASVLYKRLRRQDPVGLRPLRLRSAAWEHDSPQRRASYGPSPSS